MTEYVYALHDFAPENEDEVSFNSGDRIEIIEKDEEYCDGWWKGRNLAGKIGLFPMSYTTPAPPEPAGTRASRPEKSDSDDGPGNKSVLHPLTEEPESEPSLAEPSNDIVSPIPNKPPALSLNGNGGAGDGYESDFAEHTDADEDEELALRLGSAGAGVVVNESGGEVMKATMTDVQQAIEQLGRRGGEDGRSFSFASTNGADTETDTDFDLSDADFPPSGSKSNAGGQQWHKNARQKLANKARRAVEEAEKLEAMMNGATSGHRALAPPFEVELSEESDPEDGGEYTKSSSKFKRLPSYILEEDEEEEVNSARKDHNKEVSTTTSDKSSIATAPTVVNGTQVLLSKPRDESDLPTATASKLSFHTPVFSPSPSTDSATHAPVISADQGKDQDQGLTNETEQFQEGEKKLISRPTSNASSYPSPISSPQLPVSIPPVPLAPLSDLDLLPAPVAISLTSTLPSHRTQTPTPYLNGSGNSNVNDANNTTYIGLPSPSTSQFNNISKHNSIISSSSAPAAISLPLVSQAQSQSQNQMPNQNQQRGPADSNQLSTAKHHTHPSEWTVDEVVEWLKGRGFDQDVCDKFTEQEITGDVLLELDANLLKTELGIMAFGKRVRITNAITELRRPPSFEYSPIGQEHHPVASGSGGIIAAGAAAIGMGSPVQLQHHSSIHSSMTHSRSQSHHSGGFGYSQPGQSEPSQEGQLLQRQHLQQQLGANGTGSGISTTEQLKGLAMSPSDGALKETAKSAVPARVREEEDDKGIMSDSDIFPSSTSMRRRLFGRSQDSSILKSSSPSESIREKETSKDSKNGDSSMGVGSRPRPPPKKSMEGKLSGSGERLSIFGTTFGKSLGSGRKPPPIATDDALSSEKPSKFSLPRLHSGIRKSSSTSSRAIHSKDISVVPNSTEGISVSSPLRDTEPQTLSIASNSPKIENRHSTLRKRTNSAPPPASPTFNNSPSNVNSNLNNSSSGLNSPEAVAGLSGPIREGQSILEQIGEADHVGWMRKKGDRYNSWKLRYFLLKGPHMYWLKTDNKWETKIKGYIHIIGYKVTVDESVDPGRYGFRIDHDHDKTHYFSSDEKTVIRDWMKAIMKATIGRDYSKPVMSSYNMPTIPLVVAQTMNPAPRPPSPSARAATQKALRREHPDQLSSRDARVLMGLTSNDTNTKDEQRQRLDSFFVNDAAKNGNGGDMSPTSIKRSSVGPAPPRPSREIRRNVSVRATANPADDDLIEWANTHLPVNLRITDPSGRLCTGLGLLRLAESIKGHPCSPPVLDNAFPRDATDDKLDGLFRLFDFLLDNGVKMGAVSINDVRQGERDKIIQLLKALRAWAEKRKILASTVSQGSMQIGGGFMVPVLMQSM